MTKMQAPIALSSSTYAARNGSSFTSLSLGVPVRVTVESVFIVMGCVVLAYFSLPNKTKTKE